MSEPIDQPVEGLLEPKPRKSRGCFFWGCLGGGIVGGLLFLVIGGVIGFGLFKLREMFLQFTSEDPEPVPVYTLKPGEFKNVERRIEEFKAAAAKNEPAELVLTADDINAYIAGDDELKELGGRVFFRIEDDQILLDASIPLDELPTMKGRYLNGTLGVKLALVGGRLMMFPESIVVKGESVPEEFLKEIRKEDLLKNHRGEKQWDFVEMAKNLNVEGGKITLTR